MVRKPHPLDRIGKTTNQLERLQYGTPLDIKIGYDKISILTASQ